MGAKDIVTKAYMQDEETFADAFNFAFFDGRQMVRPERLKPLDTTLVTLPYGDGDTQVKVQRFRDVAKVLTAMEDGRAAYVLFGIENESEQKYTEPVKVMLYDVLQYVNQIEETARRHERSGRKPKGHAEFLSGFYESDRLFPVITLTIHFGSKPWTAARDLHGMIQADKEFLKYVPNYPIHLISPPDIPDAEFEKFHSELGLSLKYIKYSRDKDGLMNVVQTDERFRRASRRTFDLINGVTGSKLVFPEGKESGDMCQAIKDLIEDKTKDIVTKWDEAKNALEETKNALEEAKNALEEAKSKAQAEESKAQAAESKAQAAEQRVLQEKKKCAEILLKLSNESIEEIAEASGLNVDIIKELEENFRQGEHFSVGRIL